MKNSIASLTASLQRVRDVADDQDSRIADALRDPKLAGRFETVRAACTVLLSGYIESFLGDMARAVASEIARRSVPFDVLPPSLRIAHFELGGRLVSSRGRKKPQPDWVSASAKDLSQRLASVTAGVPYELVWEALADTRANPRFEVILAFLGRFGIEKPGRALDRVLPRGKSATELLVDGLIGLRNECAHTGGLTAIPTTSDLRSYCDVIEELAEGMIALISELLAQSPLGVNINAASAEELQRLPGVGPTRAQRVVQHRITHGPYASVESLKQIDGFTVKLVESLKTHASIT